MGAPGLRWGLLALALAWAVLAWRGRRWPTLLGGVLFVVAVLGFWATTFDQPYGSSGATAASRETAFAVRAALAPPLEGFVVGQAFQGGRWARVALLGVPVEGLVAWPTWLPLLVFPASGLAIALLWRSPLATWGAALWLAFSTSDLEALGGGVLDTLWAHPSGALAFLAAAVGALLLGRGSRRAAAGGLLLLAVAGFLSWPAAQPPADPSGLLRALLTAPWPWPVLAAVGLWRGRDPGARWCLGLGAASVLAGLAGCPLDPWPGRALWRLGLVLAGAQVLERIFGSLAARLATGRCRPAPGAGLSLLLLLAVPGSFATTWNPYDLDPVAESSAEPMSPSVAQTAAWMRVHLPADAIVVASASYAPAVVIHGQRRVLRAPGLDAAPDDLRRRRLERALFESSAAGRQNARRYGVTHVLVGPGDARLWGFSGSAPSPLPPRLQPLASPAPGFTVYALTGW
jgi:hypothetical protein